MTQALYFIVKTLVQLYLLLLLLRFWLPVLRADFRNPIAQGILRLTSPLVIPVRRFISPIGRLDTATILVAFVLELLLVLALLALRGLNVGTLPMAITAILELAIQSLNLFLSCFWRANTSSIEPLCRLIIREKSNSNNGCIG